MHAKHHNVITAYAMSEKYKGHLMIYCRWFDLALLVSVLVCARTRGMNVNGSMSAV